MNKSEKDYIAQVQRLQDLVWEYTRVEDSYGVPGSTFYSCGLCEAEQAGPGIFAGNINHAKDCPLHGHEVIPAVIYVEKATEEVSREGQDGEDILF